jgi:hypothetical protein
MTRAFPLESMLWANPCFGSALVHEKEVIHASFFRLDEPDRAEPMALCRRRRQFPQ